MAGGEPVLAGAERSQPLRAALATAGLLPVEGATAATRARRWGEVLTTAAAELVAACREPGAWDDADRAAVLEAIDRSSRALAAAKAPILVAHDEAGAWRRPGVRSFEAFRAAQSREDLGAAKRETAVARTLTALDGGVEALARGELTASHARRLHTVAEKVAPEVRAELLSGPAAAEVRALARRHEPKVFERKLEELAARRRPAAVQDAHEAIRARRFLRILPGPDGTRVEGLLDPVAGHRFQLAIEAASPRPAEDDTRTPGQRNADALEAIAAAVLAEGNLAPSHHVPTQVTITMTEETFLAAQAHLAAGSHARDDDATQAPFPTVRVQDGPLLPPTDLGKLLCASAVGRLVVGANSAPLNVGRSQRTFKSHQRRAVELRDQHCTWPGCTQVARYCEVHHLDHWVADHGETDVNRGVLVCTFHHHELHRHDLDLVVRPRGESDGEHEHGATPRAALPGDPDYRPPRYELVPRAQTADERRARLVARLPRPGAARERARTRASAAPMAASQGRDPARSAEHVRTTGHASTTEHVHMTDRAHMNGHAHTNGHAGTAEHAHSPRRVVPGRRDDTGRDRRAGAASGEQGVLAIG